MDWYIYGSGAACDSALLNGQLGLFDQGYFDQLGHRDDRFYLNTEQAQRLLNVV